MTTLPVLGRSLFTFLVVAVLAVGGFLLTDAKPLDEAVPVAPSSTQAVPSPTTPEATSASIEAPPTTTQVTTVPTTSTTVTIDQIPQQGSGAFVPASVNSELTAGSGNIIEFSVAAEQDSGIDPQDLADKVEAVLGDERSWIGEGNMGFRRVETGGLFTVVVATAGTVDRLCAPLRTNGIFSCARNGWVAINLNRWLTATNTWTTNLDEYQTYVVNHEIGHYLARPHVGCPAPGALAPVMMQQTKGLGECQANGWPYPETEPVANESADESDESTELPSTPTTFLDEPVDHGADPDS